MKNWRELMSIRDIQVFISFANFYRHFIQNFNRIAALLISMLKTTRLFQKLALRVFKADNNKIVEDDGGRADEMVVNSSKSKNKKSRKLTYMPNIGATKKPNFLTSNTKKGFNHLRLAFIETLIFRHFNLENHIRIKTDISNYAIGRVSSQLNLDSYASSNQWHLIAYFFRKMIPAET